MNHTKICKNSLSFIIPLTLLYSSSAFAQSTSLETMWANSLGAWLALSKLAQFAAVIMGFYFVIGSILKFSQLGSNPQLSPKVPIVMFLVGVALFAITPSISIIHYTMFSKAPGSVLSETAGGSSCGGFSQTAIWSVFAFIKLVGIIAFIRGWLLLNQSALGKDGVIGRGLVHIFGGVAAMNITLVANVLANTFFKDLPLKCLGI